MTILETIPLKPTNLSRQRPTETMDMWLELREHSIRYFHDFYADETATDDPVLRTDLTQWENTYNHMDLMAPKEGIAGVEMAYCEESNVWKVTIYISGIQGDIRIYFLKQDEAQSLFDKLGHYLYDFEPNKQ